MQFKAFSTSNISNISNSHSSHTKEISKTPLNISRQKLFECQQQDPFLSHLINYLKSDCSKSSISNLSIRNQNLILSMASRVKIIDNLLYYSDEFDSRLRVYIPSNPELQKQLIQTYHDSPLGMHRGRDATYAALSREYFWKSMSKHVRNWVRRCKHCIRFKSSQPKHGPMHIRLYNYPFHTIGIDYVGELPVSPSGNKYILTAVCPFSNFLITAPVPNKNATTAARVLLDQVFFKFGFPQVIQSDRGKEFLNAILFRIMQILSIKHVLTTSYRPRLNGVTERVHRFLNEALGIFCEKHQTNWEAFLQAATYSHNVSPIPTSTNLDPFLLNFGRHAPPPEKIDIQMPINSISQDKYAVNLIKNLKQAHSEFKIIKADLRRSQRDHYDSISRHIEIPTGKIVYIRNHTQPSKGETSRFIRNFDGPYVVHSHFFNRPDLMILQDPTTNDLLKPINIEKIVVAP